MKDRPELMPTGIPGLDQLLEGGVIRKNSLLIEGPPGSGKSTLGVRILYEGATRYDEPGLLITFEEFPRQLYQESLSSGIDLQALEEAGKLRVVWTPPARVLESFRGKSDLVEKIVKEIGVRRLLIDSITHFKRIAADEVSLREILSTILTNLKIAGVNAMLVKELERQDDETIAFEEYLVDASLRLHTRSDEAYERNSRYIEIRKTRGQGHVSGRHPFRLDGGELRIFPRLRVQDVTRMFPREPPEPVGRTAFGVEGLDDMLAGGLVPQAPTVVSGYAGCGKSVLSCHFLNEGLKAGGSGLLLSLKGDAEAVVASAKSLGMDWEPTLESGRLRVLHCHPLGPCIEEIVQDLMEEVQRQRPERFVCDSVDCLAQVAVNAGQLREQLLVVTEICAAAGVTPLFLLDAQDMGGEPDAGLLWLSHLAACSIKFSMAEIEGAVRRFILVVKHAGSGHAKELREVQIDGRGLRVVRLATGLSGILTGQAQRALKNLSEDVLPALRGVDETLLEIAKDDALSNALLEQAKSARKRVAEIDAQLREYFGGVDLAEEEVDAPPDERWGNARILLAEDNTTNQRVVLGILGKLGLSADVVSSGDEAVKALETFRYDLALMDVEMPGMNGLEAAQRIRDPRTPVLDHDIPIIALTAYAMEEDRQRCLEHGMNGHLAKPLQPTDLREVLEKWLTGKKPGRRETPPATVGASPVWDRKAFMHRMSHDEALAKEVVEAALIEIPMLTDRLRRRIEQGDLSDAREQAHAIKGAASNLSAETLRLAAERVERAAAEGDRQALPAALETLDAEAEAFKRETIGRA